LWPPLRMRMKIVLLLRMWIARFQMSKTKEKVPPLGMKIVMAQLPRTWTARFLSWKRKMKAVLRTPMKMKIVTNLLLRKSVLPSTRCLMSSYLGAGKSSCLSSL
ncbi:hypothetical protein B0H11DRAFT_1996521, partial [Mycena galericulata]